MTDSILAWAASHPDILLLLILAISFLESLAIAGLVVPGVALLFGFATLAGHGHLPLGQCLIAAIAGAIAGDALSFYLGRRFRDQIWTIWPLNRDPDLRQRGEGFVARHGGKSILIGRFVGPVRPVIPMVAGSLDMPPGRFLFFNILSALGWGPFYFLPGYLAGSAIHIPTLTVHSPILLAASVTLIALGAALVAAEIHLHLRSRPSHQVSTWKFVALTAGSAFIVWTALHVGAQVGQSLDLLTYTFFSYRQPAFQGVFVALTLLGDPILLYPLFGIFLAMLAYQGHRRTAIIYLFGGLLLHAVTSLLKAWFALPRPPEAFYPPSFAYPSGHAAGATFVYGLVAITLLHPYTRQINRLGVALAGFLILMIASSRIYLNVHWLSDIIGGTLLGVMLASLANGLSKLRPDPPSAHDFTPRQTAGLLVIWLITCVCHIAVRWTTALGQYPIPVPAN